MMTAPLPDPTVPEVSQPAWKIPLVRQLLIVALLAEIGYAVLNVSTMPVYLKADPGVGHMIPEGRGLGESVIGLVVVAFLFSEAVFKSPMGVLADRIGHRRLMLAGPVITSITSLLTLVIPFKSGALEVILLILLRVLDGVGAAMMWPAAFALMGNIVKDEQRQQAMSLLNLCYMLGIALALPLGGAVNDLSGHRYASLFFASMIFLAVAISVARFIPARAHVEHSTEHSEGGFSDLLRAVKELPSFLILALVTFCGIGFPMVVVKLFAQDEFNMGESAFGGLVFPAAIAMSACAVPLSRLGEKLGNARAVHYGLGLGTLGLIFICLGAAFPFLRSPWALAFGCIPTGLGFLLSVPAWTAAVSDIDPNRRGANLGAVMTAQGLGAIIGAPIGSSLYEKLVPTFGQHIAHYTPFIGCAACMGFGWLLSLRLLK